MPRISLEYRSHIISTVYNAVTISNKKNSEYLQSWAKYLLYKTQFDFVWGITINYKRNVAVKYASIAYVCVSDAFQRVKPFLFNSDGILLHVCSLFFPLGHCGIRPGSEQVGVTVKMSISKIVDFLVIVKNCCRNWRCWPPSPYRLLAAMYGFWYRRLNGAITGS